MGAVIFTTAMALPPPDVRGEHIGHHDGSSEYELFSSEIPAYLFYISTIYILHNHGHTNDKE